MTENIANDNCDHRHVQLRDTSRSAAACNGCRARKQKCDGERPICLRCRSLGQECEWPKAQKRGPAKAYTEAVEARLQETENILIRVLSTIPHEQLSDVLSAACGEAAPFMCDQSKGHVTVPKSRLAAVHRKASIEYWNKYALTSPEEIRVWLADQNSSYDLRQHPDKEGEDRGENEMIGTLNQWPMVEMRGKQQINIVEFGEQRGSTQTTIAMQHTNNDQLRGDVIEHDSGNLLTSCSSELAQDSRAKQDQREGSPTTDNGSPVTRDLKKQALGIPDDFKERFMW
ncbi:hypothetical protein B0O99DRAFT_621345 [Bisporella sp. PMI_857]|nr:hypothetical protein B0O99DRAFT_621345 [Bisporella sp. PMI_857]